LEIPDAMLGEEMPRVKYPRCQCQLNGKDMRAEAEGEGNQGMLSAGISLLIV